MEKKPMPWGRERGLRRRLVDLEQLRESMSAILDVHDAGMGNVNDV